MISWESIKRQFREVALIHKDQIDREDAVRRIKEGIWFRGPNVWILAFAIVLASVGLNVNSTAVIIGAMLVSPLMGPIMGVGLSLGINDIDLLKQAAKNLLIMVVVSLLASSLYFLISPLRLVNPTELLARTTPTIYDVLIGLFGGLAGILENSRKERGTVIAGVAIATALMPPLCTAGFGLAHLSAHFFFGALYLFLINSVFIILATYTAVVYLHFPKVDAHDIQMSERRRRIISWIIVLFVVPSIWSAVSMVRDNNFERNVSDFVSAHRFIDGRYIYDYTITSGRKRQVELRVAGDALGNKEREDIYAAAARYAIRPEKIRFVEHNFTSERDERTEKLILDLMERADGEFLQRDLELEALKNEVEQLRNALDTLQRPPEMPKQ